MFKKTIKEYELGVEWNKGQIVGLLKPGKHALYGFSHRAEVFDARQVVLRVPGQEIVLSDRVSAKVNITGIYQIVDPVKLVRQIPKNTLQEHATQLVQLAIRTVLAEKTFDDLLEKRDEINTALLKELTKGFAEIGLKLSDSKIKDVILPSELRKAYTETLSAQLRSKAQLEQARGQSAALRNLANTADLIEKHPQLIQLLGLQKQESLLNLHLETSKDSSKK